MLKGNASLSEEQLKSLRDIADGNSSLAPIAESLLAESQGDEIRRLIFKRGNERNNRATKEDTVALPGIQAQAEKIDTFTTHITTWSAGIAADLVFWSHLRENLKAQVSTIQGIFGKDSKETVSAK